MQRNDTKGAARKDLWSTLRRCLRPGGEALTQKQVATGQQNNGGKQSGLEEEFEEVVMGAVDEGGGEAFETLMRCKCNREGSDTASDGEERVDRLQCIAP